MPIEPIGSAAAGGHRRDQQAQFLLGVAEDLLTPGDGLVRVDHVLAFGQFLEVDQPGVQPLAVRMLGGQFALDVVVVADLAARGVDQEHPARLQPALGHHLGRVDVEHTGLAAQHDQTVGGLPPPPGAQPVAVEHGADQRAVGEADAGRAVPGLHQRGVEAVEVAPAGSIASLFSHASGIIISTAWGRVRPARCSSSSTSSNVAESLASGVQTGNARDRPRDSVGLEQRLAGPHPVAVAADGVDLAVVRDVAVRMGQRPRREGVGREPAVHQADGAGHPLVAQVREEPAQLVGGQHPLVDQGAGRQRHEVQLDAGLRGRGARPPCGRRTPAGRARSRSRPPRRPRTAGGTRGMTARAVGPRPDASVGTSRQPSRRRPSSATVRSIRSTAGCGSSAGTNTRPAAYWPAGGQFDAGDGPQEHVGHWPA